jgi:hypothetical protein
LAEEVYLPRLIFNLVPRSYSQRFTAIWKGHVHMNVFSEFFRSRFVCQPLLESFWLVFTFNWT